MKDKDYFTVFTEQTTSTMDFAKQYMQNHNHDGQIIAVVAKSQTQARGRGGSSWQQINSSNIASDKLDGQIVFYDHLSDVVLEHNDFLPVTFVIPSERIKIPYEWITAIMGCALYDALKVTESFIKSTFPYLTYNIDKNIYIKWPNDIIFISEKLTDSKLITKYKKISGILCETSTSGSKIGDFYIGIGLNFFNHPQIEKSVSFWESLFFNEKNKSNKREINKTLATPEFRQAILNKFCETLQKEISDYICTSRGKSQLRALTLERSLPIGTLLSVDKGTRQGEFVGLDENAGLILSGTNKPIITGEVTLKESVAEKKNPNENKVSLIKNITPTVAIDFGNTTIHFAFQCSNLNKYQIDIPYDSILSSEKNKIREALKPCLDGFIVDRMQKIDILYTSVTTSEKTNLAISKIKEYLNSIFPEMTFQDTKIIEKEILSIVNLSNEYDVSRLGEDRALKLLFASKQAQKNNENIVVFSFGTAVTCEGVSPSLNIIENYIFPGIQMALNAINHYTALVPLFHANSNKVFPQDKDWNQEIYVQRGVFLSTASSVMATLNMHNPCRCYFTGGNAEIILSIINSINPKHNFKIEIIPSIETNMIIEYKSHFLKNKNTIKFEKIEVENKLNKIKKITNQNSIIPSFTNLHEEGKIGQVMQSMMKARDPKKIDRTLEPKQEDFRKIGSHLENIQSEERIDAYMASKFQFHNRDTWRERIQNGEVLIEHGAHRKIKDKVHLNKIKPTYKLKNYDQIWLYHPTEYEPDVIDKLDVIFDDGDLCIFAKPPNMVIHAAGIYGKNTFVNISAKMGYSDCAAVHRIDRETSGILACARKTETRSIISDAFRQGNIEKMYIAVAKGKNNLPNHFRVSLPIGEPENSLIRLKLWVNGNLPQQAETWFSKLGTFEDYTMYACLPQTGRTNQIRIHLAAIGQWIVGDKMYHKDEQVFIQFYEQGYTDWVHEQTLFPRHMLHNAGIMASNISLPSLALNPIVCELYSDMMESNIVKNLLKNSSIPLDVTEQREYFKNIFLNLHKLNFNEFPEIQQGDNP
ncbi:type III pantothenate kinase [Silvanigrella aquatica]|uniref:pantothenate kinase n=1 Tax=Silvanigrella aquatica TaxID=1915309 RepID=A0A1L4D3T2_9BACT|nr:type III pantothenate kinase [Silvanigrella aquatica]APJ04840.1 hypothetical protein AXG55_13410 [Silvanigrella aquatica]